MGRTVFTQQCLDSMVSKGTFRKVRLADLKTEGRSRGFDEIFYFRFPSTSILNEMNGDGDFMEIEDYAHDLSKIFTASEDIATTPETFVYVR